VTQINRMKEIVQSVCTNS